MEIKIPTATNENIAVSVQIPQHQTNGILFIAHGLAGYKEEPYLQLIKEIFIKKKYTVVLYDARYTLGENDGPLENACFSKFIEDLNSVIQWAQKQPFYKEPFFLCGHSLGAGACLDYACKNPQNVHGVISLSAVYNGQFLLDSYIKNKPDFVKKWQEEKFLFRQREDNPKKNGFISYNHIIDACSYSLDTEVHKIKASVLVVCGDHDISSTQEINKKLYNSLKSKKRIEIIENCGHNYKKEENLLHLQQITTNWLDDII